ncbi:TAXI family TRAP transporter solute-binding subunit [Desulfovibrio sp. Fe33]|uniref:TAXI family TRAP transporter solute-binding subunit n=1 Tax=Desulfovibrio sp. Fe33 TaxID=3020842 RepID=UPI00234C1CC1|nr:TAXI family TRAP transporter solute-binding subunit [Desulfovibrio sp. Fe33]
MSSCGKFRIWLVGFVVLLLAACGGAPSEDNESQKSASSGSCGTEGNLSLVTIGTGGISGVYYPVGRAIGNMVNRNRDRYGFQVVVESTGGSVFNINAVVAGDIQFGIAQADRQYQAVCGIAEWQGRGARKNLRAVFSLHPETLTLVAAADSGIRGIRDLKGRRVNIGNPGSGQRQNSLDALNAVGLKPSDLEIVEAKAIEAIELLKEGSIDAFFYTVGHPSSAIREITQGPRKVRIVPIDDVGHLYVLRPFYVPAGIDMADYPGAANEEKRVESFGVKATLVTSSDVPDSVVYALTREVFENFDDFKAQQSAFSELTKTSMLQGQSAPIHPGAMRYYEEIGLLQPE